MTARKLSIWTLLCAGAVALAFIALQALAGGATAAPRHGTFTRIKIDAWPHGVFGYVNSPSAHRCADGRRVIVFKERGSGRHPRRDKRIGVARTRRNHGLYQWVQRTRKTGRIYAKAPRSSGCAGALSKSVHVAPGAGTDDTGNHYPVCGPYVSEGTTSICHFTRLDARLPDCHSFTKDKDQCDAKILDGPYPWWGGGATFAWDRPNNGFVGWFAYDSGVSNDTAHLLGHSPGPGAKQYTIDEAFAENDQGHPNGDYFYTPDIPGVDAGEVGGPLYLRYFQDEHEPGIPYRVQIYGYLYLKR